MATRNRRRRQRKKSKRLLLFLPIVLFAAVLVWLFLEEVKQLMGSAPTRTATKTSAPSKKPISPGAENILDPERKKLDDILKSR